MVVLGVGVHSPSYYVKIRTPTGTRMIWIFVVSLTHRMRTSAPHDR